MTDNERLDEIKNRLNANAYLANSAVDVRFLLEQIERLQKKSDILYTQNLELTQEMENIKSDFGNNR